MDQWPKVRLIFKYIQLIMILVFKDLMTIFDWLTYYFSIKAYAKPRALMKDFPLKPKNIDKIRYKSTIPHQKENSSSFNIFTSKNISL